MYVCICMQFLNHLTLANSININIIDYFDYIVTKLRTFITRIAAMYGRRAMDHILNPFWYNSCNLRINKSPNLNQDYKVTYHYSNVIYFIWLSLLHIPNNCIHAIDSTYCMCKKF